MNLNASDFFKSITELLGVLAPGAFFIFILSTETPQYFESTLFELNKFETNNTVIFIFLAYIAGSFIHFFGAILLNPCYENFYLPKKLEKHKLFINQVDEAIKTQNSLHIDPIRIADTYLRLHHPAISADIDQHEATSKFFRGISIVFIGYFYILLPDNNGKLIALVLIISCMSFWRFCNQRWKKHLLTYEFFIQAKTNKNVNS